MWAVIKNASLNVVKALLKAGADFYQSDNENLCALTLSVSRNSNVKIRKNSSKAEPTF